MIDANLGAALRELRESTGHKANAVARSAAMSASKLSKIEHGRIAPSVMDVDRILAALEVTGEVKDQFLRAARVAATEATAWRLYRRLGFHKHQDEIAAIEAQTNTVRLFQLSVIPGLLQSPEYARAVLARKELTDDVLARTLGARLERQQILYGDHRKFRFLVAESVLRWHVVAQRMMATQLDRLVSLSRLPSVELGVIPLDRPMPDYPSSSFAIFDSRLAIVELPHCEVATREPQDVDLYIEKFERLTSVAVHDDAMRAMVASIRDKMLRGQETI